MSCSWNHLDCCDTHVAVRPEKAEEFFEAVLEYGLLDCFFTTSLEEAFDKRPGGPWLYSGDSFVNGDAGYSYYEVIREEIMSLAEPGSYVDVVNSDEFYAVRIMADKVLFGELTISW